MKEFDNRFTLAKL